MKRKGTVAVLVILLLMVLGTLLTYFMFAYFEEQGRFEEKSMAIEEESIQTSAMDPVLNDPENGNIMNENNWKEAM